MHSDAEWHTFLRMVCECADMDVSAVPLDRGLKSFFSWLPPECTPSEAMQHVLEVMPLQHVVAWLQSPAPPAPRPTPAQLPVVADRPRSNREGKRKMPAAAPAQPLGSHVDAAFTCKGNQHFVDDRQRVLPCATGSAAGYDADGPMAPDAKRRSTMQPVAGRHDGLASMPPTSESEDDWDVVVCTDSDSELECAHKNCVTSAASGSDDRPKREHNEAATFHGIEEEISDSILTPSSSPSSTEHGDAKHALSGDEHLWLPMNYRLIWS